MKFETQQKLVIQPAERRRVDSIGPLPTQAERQEGKAFEWLLCCPKDARAANSHRNAWNALQRAQEGNIALLRCAECHTTKWGRTRQQPCGVCGEVGGYYG